MNCSFASTLDDAAHIKKFEDELKQHAIFAHELQSALWSTAEF